MGVGVGCSLGEAMGPGLSGWACRWAVASFEAAGGAAGGYVVSRARRPADAASRDGSTYGDVRVFAFRQRVEVLAWLKQEVSAC